MIILAIDTSCDDTCIAILKIKNGKLKILGNVVSSQVKIHRKYGGVYPTLAKREHQKNLVEVLKRALKEARLLKGAKLAERTTKGQDKDRTETVPKILEREEVLYLKLKDFLEKYEKPKIDVIVVTVGPGLEPCLWVGVNFAKALSFYWEKPIVPINHIEAHIFANFLPKVSSNFQFHYTTPSTLPPSAGPFFLNFQKIFPTICLVVSGGHTQLILMREIGDYKIIGETRDDAAGECFDKTARILGLEYPGGPAIAQQAEQWKSQTPMTNDQTKTIKLPRPMMNSKDYDFSFSGLKTAVLYDFRGRPKKMRASKEYIREMAKEIQQAIVDVLIKKTIKAAKSYKVKAIILGGGVAANKELRKQLQLKIKKEGARRRREGGGSGVVKLKINFLVPPKNLCTDNAAMVGITGYINRNKKISWRKIKANANLRI